ncbi:hypothetical protein SERLA73DRAFT_184505 [Serpula lacrymans var. lacrymans S7.3]|uniref:SigF-like NTF2-like domain-containing protein n=2 Tax=Serpula lacrymans var. lacrymans TaxID=341189 RepID=F8Q3D9_SERL3|nr:uncharacterized protein SERLADRAFT_472219 [Serpula lacrymans var. lacrymans S7.9]EGN97700.1 hypothetical protein SERLA73DRAFT_184505 [Serpula lacrymans var. lacrymans S7.3]EGO23291.1 hypothetical protein SERLADRAFT_472219 [Serpula lacrymans var. lacrymans S7.9]
MQNPQREIVQIAQLLTSSAESDAQQKAVLNYFTTNASLRDPLCVVESSPNSRDTILGVYQWYRILSPNTRSNIQSILYDRELDLIDLEIVQVFKARFSPFKPAESRFLIRLSMREDNGLHYIARQENFLQPDDVLNILIPPLAPLLRLGLNAAAIVYNMNARALQATGLWKPDPKFGTRVSGRSVQESKTN